jgi:hypothetical protein
MPDPSQAWPFFLVREVPNETRQVVVEPGPDVSPARCVSQITLDRPQVEVRVGTARLMSLSARLMGVRGDAAESRGSRETVVGCSGPRERRPAFARAGPSITDEIVHNRVTGSSRSVD